jgi:hypothetical protein
MDVVKGFCTIFSAMLLCVRFVEAKTEQCSMLFTPAREAQAHFTQLQMHRYYIAAPLY